MTRFASPWLPWKTVPSRERPPKHLEWRTAGRACGDARCRPSAAPQVRGPQTSGGEEGWALHALAMLNNTSFEGV